MKRHLSSFLLEIWLPVAIFGAWWVFSYNSTSYFFPPLRTIAAVTIETWTAERIAADLIPSLRNFLVGFAIAAVLGIAIGVLLGLWRPARRATEPTVDFLRSVPAPALISIFIVLLGFRTGMKITAIAFASLFPILLNTIDGVRGVDPVQLDMARAYRLRLRDRIFQITLPAASPQIFVGLRISVAVALAVMVFSEMFAGIEGLGFFIIFAQQTYRIPEMYSGIIIIGLLGYVVNLVFLIAERRIMRWHRGARAGASDLKAVG